MYPSSNQSGGFDPLHDGPEMDHQIPKQLQPKDPPAPIKQPVNDLLGFRDPMHRLAAGGITLVLLVLVIIGLRLFLGDPKSSNQPVSQNLRPGITPTITLNVPAPALEEVKQVAFTGGIPRLALMHTNLPDRPREDIEKYTVQEGDTVIGIAKKYGLKPETILWANYFTLLDNPSYLQPGDILNILPVDGVYHRWSAGEGLNGVASFYKVTPDAIINYSLNHLNSKTIGDLSNPNIAPDTWLVIPNGTREFVNWSAPYITRSDPSAAKVLGAGACGATSGGAIGTGAFIWPTNHHFLSGFDYTPETNHYGIDLDGETGDPVYAADSGVVVYAGWNDRGYGNEIIIDHGNGWQTVYGHLSAIKVECGSSVYQGAIIGLVGSTGHSSGSHLHFEIQSEVHGKVNPHLYLPAP
jgi:murein DD-endopeptidase MepM/ murein hydrolase activator NlpD